MHNVQGANYVTYLMTDSCVVYFTGS